MAETLASEVSGWIFNNVRPSVKVEHTKLWCSVRLDAEETARALYEYDTARARYEYDTARVRYEYYTAKARFEDLGRQVTPGRDGIIRRKYDRGCVRNIVSEEVYSDRRST